jgi:hypothetical protein
MPRCGCRVYLCLAYVTAFSRLWEHLRQPPTAPDQSLLRQWLRHVESELDLSSGRGDLAEPMTASTHVKGGGKSFTGPKYSRQCRRPWGPGSLNARGSGVSKGERVEAYLCLSLCHICISLASRSYLLSHTSVSAQKSAGR